MSEATDCDVLLIGGGLANSLIALELRKRRPDLRIVMLERQPAPDQAHTWCLFESDVAEQSWRALLPLFDHQWQGYDVIFPDHRRVLSTRYACLTSVTLAAAVGTALGPDMQYGVSVSSLSADGAVCENGRRYHAPLIIDGRGGRRSRHLTLAFQKFVGSEVLLHHAHGLERPRLMDAAIEQTDGFRFVYVLPLAPDRLLIEDTRYSASAELDVPSLRADIAGYAESRGWPIARTLRQEIGVLPIVLGGDIDAYWDEQGDEIPRVGLRGVFFHPTTGYSLPAAVQLAELIAGGEHFETRGLARMLRVRSVALWRQRGFYRALNRMMFLAADPVQRYRILERFYRLPQPLIERFYAGRLTFADKARIVAGRPPVPIHRALAALPEAAALRSHA